MIWLDSGLLTGLTDDGTGHLASSDFFIGQANKATGQHIIYDTQMQTLFYDADGAGAGAAVRIAIVSKNLVLDAGDFVIA